MMSRVVGDLDFSYGSLQVHDPGKHAMEHTHPTGHSQLARKLILDELFDLSLYQALHKLSTGDTRSVLQELIQVEEKHYAFWQDFFHTRVESLDLSRRVKLWVILLACRLFGIHAVHLVLEAIEVYGVRKYLTLWETYQGGPLGDAVRGILEEEFQHEDVVVSALAERQIEPEKIRNIFLGFNDGLVEILGAVSGFFGAFDEALTVLMAAVTVAVAGSLSMAAGAYVASSSEHEVRQTEREKRAFLEERTAAEETVDRPASAAFLVGSSYFTGATVPVLPVLFGAKHALWSLLVAGSMIIVVSTVLSFLSGMDIKKRIATNLVIIAAAVGITYTIGTVANMLWGISL
jgi:vacuolar iron transporter family protein